MDITATIAELRQEQAAINERAMQVFNRIEPELWDRIVAQSNDHNKPSES